MSKVVLIVLDGVGAGELPDAADYGDKGSNTLGNTAEAVGGLRLPHLQELGLGNVVSIKGVPPCASPLASYGKLGCLSKGKDSTTGHWELAGLVVKKEFPVYPAGFPRELMDRFVRTTGVRGFLGNMPASGTVIIQQLGDEHVRTGFPIVYTSADSVFQIAAHEETVPLEKLYAICKVTRQQVCIGSHAVGRVIARPFLGANGSYTRTVHRRDFSLAPQGLTLLDLLQGAGIPTVGIGKIDDLYAGRGLGKVIHTTGNAEGVERIVQEASTRSSGFIMANLVDFDMLYGHRNDPAGFARALEEFDAAIPALLGTLGPDDVLILTADHGNDPVTPSTDHSREYVPVLWYARGRPGIALGTRATFADVGRTVAGVFGLDGPLAGTNLFTVA
ncbi:MAG TPA: phosphopentomutase [Bacteroidota bacterium]